MKKIFNFTFVSILLPIIILTIFSILNMYSTRLIVNIDTSYFFKQILWVFLSIILIISVFSIKLKYIFKYSWIIYLVNIILLILVLFIGTEVNGTKAWFDLKYFSFQPSETMKLSLILFLSSVISNSKLNNLKNEFILIIKVLLITIIPSFLTLIEPDTGAVIVFLIVAFIMLFAANLKLRWFSIGISVFIVLGVSFFYIYFTNQELFIQIFKTDFFYRIDRILEFNSGLQIENALTAIGSAGIFGTGINHISIYFPESQTDFIFALSIENFGLVGGLIIISCYIYLFIILFRQIKRQDQLEYKFYIIGFLSMFIYQVIQNTFMNLGILPIVGITLPFLSYGGTSTILYFVSIGLILKMNYDKEKYPYRIF